MKSRIVKALGIPYGEVYYRRTWPKATLSIIVANVIVYLITSYENFFIQLSDYWVNAGGYVPALASDPYQLYRVLTSMFLHGDIFHIFFNMYFLYIFGRAVEDALGHGRYLLLYFASGVAASIFHTAFSLLGGLNSFAIPAVGASGAISGVLGAYLLLYPGTSLSACFIFFFYPVCFSMRAAFYLIFWFATQVIYGYARVAGEVAVFAHAGGFLAGIALLPALINYEKVKTYRMLNYFKRLPFLILTYPKVRGLSHTSKYVLTILMTLVLLGSVYTTYASQNLGEVKTLNIEYSVNGSEIRDYVVLTINAAGVDVSGVPLDSTRILLNRLNGADLLYNESKAGKEVSLTNVRLDAKVRVGNRYVNVVTYIKTFKGLYDSRGFLTYGSGTIETQAIIISGSNVLTGEWLTYDFNIHTQDVALKDLTQVTSFISAVTTLTAIYTVLKKDSDLALVGEE